MCLHKTDPSALYFPNPFSKKNKIYRFDARCKFPLATGPKWAEYLNQIQSAATIDVDCAQELTNQAYTDVIQHVWVDYCEYKDAYDEGMAIDRLLKHVSLAELAGEVAIEHINYNVQDSMDQAANALVLPSTLKSLTKVLGRPD